MKTFPVRSASGRSRAFEIENIYLSMRQLRRLIGEADRVHNVRVPGRREQREGVRLEFDYDGEPYMIWEPYADNSRFWIGPRAEPTGEESPGIRALELRLENYRVPILWRLLGDLLSLKFLSLLRTK